MCRGHPELEDRVAGVEGDGDGWSGGHGVFLSGGVSPRVCWQDACQVQ